MFFHPCTPVNLGGGVCNTAQRENRRGEFSIALMVSIW